MSKAKKAAYVEKQRTTAATATARQLTPLTENAPMAKTVKKVTTRKQSRGK
jgi:hypothetical protein